MAATRRRYYHPNDPDCPEPAYTARYDEAQGWMVASVRTDEIVAGPFDTLTAAEYACSDMEEDEREAGEEYAAERRAEALADDEPPRSWDRD